MLNSANALETEYDARGMKNKNGRRDVVEGFRVLTLLHRMDEIPSEQREWLANLFKNTER